MTKAADVSMPAAPRSLLWRSGPALESSVFLLREAPLRLVAAFLVMGVLSSIAVSGQPSCKKGKPCGNTCIAQNRTCRIQPTPKPTTPARDTAAAKTARDTVSSARPLAASGTPSEDTSTLAKTGQTKVWANTKSRVYHCPGSRYYGTTSAGEWMTEAAALKANYRGANNRRCGSP